MLATVHVFERAKTSLTYRDSRERMSVEDSERRPLIERRTCGLGAAERGDSATGSRATSGRRQKKRRWRMLMQAVMAAVPWLALDVQSRIY
jgi:hypothetical protein